MASVIVDGETHRAKLLAQETLNRMDEVLQQEQSLTAEKAPELVLGQIKDPTIHSDIWSMTATILEFLLDTRVWDTLSSGKSEAESVSSIRQAMQLKMQPSITPILMGANQKLQFLADGLNYSPEERPPTTSTYRRLHQAFIDCKKS
jgi:hypothetical protein